VVQGKGARLDSKVRNTPRPEKAYVEETVMRWQRFLVPLDFSPDADHALAYAIRWATALQAHLTLLHILELPKLVDMSLTPYRIAMETTSKRELEARLQRVHQAGVAGEMMRVHGVPFQEIIAIAKAIGADLIIMGTHGRTGLRHALMGSVAEKVVRLAPCAVVVTRPSDAMPTPEGEADAARGMVSAPD
jgi:nucleotide-binding universal stress UspA family protein